MLKFGIFLIFLLVQENVGQKSDVYNNVKVKFKLKLKLLNF